MIGILVVSHGRLADALISSVKILVGHLHRIKGVSIGPKDQEKEVKDRIRQKMAEVNDGEGESAPEARRTENWRSFEGYGTEGHQDRRTLGRGGDCWLDLEGFDDGKGDGDPEIYTRVMESDRKNKGGGSYKNVKLTKTLSLVSVTGEMTNDSGKNFTAASFIITFYDRKNRLLETGDILINNLSKGQTKPFTAYIENLNYESVHRYRIEFDFGV